MQHFHMRVGVLALVLVIVPLSSAAGISPERLREVLTMAGERVPGGYVLEVDVDDPREDPMVSIEFDSGTEVYVDAGRMRIVEVERYREREAGDLLRSTSADIRNGVRLWDAYATALDEVDSGEGRGSPFHLYGIEYELRYGRLVLEIEFRRVAPGYDEGDATVWRRSSRYVALVDPVEGSVINIREDRD